MRSYYGLDALAAGVSLAPTSIGIALKLLLESEYLETVVGQAIIAAAFFDDILSLIAFGLLADFGNRDPDAPFDSMVEGAALRSVGGHYMVHH